MSAEPAHIFQPNPATPTDSSGRTSARHSAPARLAIRSPRAPQAHRTAASDGPDRRRDKDHRDQTRRDTPAWPRSPRPPPMLGATSPMAPASRGFVQSGFYEAPTGVALAATVPPRLTEPSRFKGYDAGKRIHGRKRHILTDTDGRLLTVEVHGADVQDRDGAKAVLKRSRRRFPFVERVFADGGYAGKARAMSQHQLPIPGLANFCAAHWPAFAPPLTGGCAGRHSGGGRAPLRPGEGAARHHAQRETGRTWRPRPRGGRARARHLGSERQAA